MHKVNVSVIITAFNAEKFIRQSLDSVLSQTCEVLEILVVDDGSSDSTVEILKTYGKKITILEKVNGGPASARNYGLKHAKGKYIAFLDADDIWLNTKIARQIEVIESDPAIGLVYTEAKNILNDEPAGKIQKPMVNGNIFKYLFWGNFIGPSMVLIKKECFDRLGNFDERKDFIGVEDYDMWLRVTKEYEARCITDELVYYRVHLGGISKNIDRAYANEKSVIDEIRKRWPHVEKETGISFNKRFAKLYQHYGLDNFEFGRKREARDKFLKSLGYNWANLRTIVGLIKTFLPDVALKNLRKLRRSSEDSTLYNPRS